MDILTIENIKLNQHFTTKESAIRAAGEVLVLAGYVEADYVAAMVQRENDVTTYMGIFIAIPMEQMRPKNTLKNQVFLLFKFLMVLILVLQKKKKW